MKLTSESTTRAATLQNPKIWRLSRSTGSSSLWFLAGSAWLLPLSLSKSPFYYKTLYGRNLQMFMILLSWPFQLSLIFVSKATGPPYSGASERGFSQAGSGLSHKHWTKLERPLCDKHFSLLWNFVNYSSKSL
jgi:hypothetical protein